MNMEFIKDYGSGETPTLSVGVSEPSVRTPRLHGGSSVPGVSSHLTNATVVSSPAQGSEDRGKITESTQHAENPDSFAARDSSGKDMDDFIMDDSYEETGVYQMVEDAIRQYSVRIERSKPRYLLLRGEFLDRNSIVVVDALLRKENAELGGRMLNIQKGRGNFRSLILEVEENVVDSWLRVRSIIGQRLDVVAHPTMNMVRGKFVDRDGYLDGYNDVEVFNCLQNQAVEKVQRIYRWERKDGRGVQMQTRTFIVHFALRTIPSQISLGFVKLPVDYYVQEPLRCFKCQEYGHGDKGCTNPRRCRRCSKQHGQCDLPAKCSVCEGEHITGDRCCIRLQEMKDDGDDTKICYKCIKVGHLSKDCLESRRCKRCLGDHGIDKCEEARHCYNCEGNHEAGFRKCPVYQKNYKMMELVATQQISVGEARKRVFDTPVGGTLAERINVVKEDENVRLSALEKSMKDMNNKFVELMDVIKGSRGNENADVRFQKMEQRMDSQEREMNELKQKNIVIEREKQQLEHQLDMMQRERGLEKLRTDEYIEKLKGEIAHLKESNTEKSSKKVPQPKSQEDRRELQEQESSDKKEIVQQNQKPVSVPPKDKVPSNMNSNKSQKPAPVVKRLNNTQGRSSSRRPNSTLEQRLKESSLTKAPVLGKSIKTGGSQMHVEPPSMRE